VIVSNDDGIGRPNLGNENYDVQNWSKKKDGRDISENKGHYNLC
jgi:hypothetical protein